jgi:hypothetical protein
MIQRVIVNKQTGNLIDGEMRVELAIEKKQSTIPVVYVNLSREEELIALAYYDSVGDMAEIDLDALTTLTKEFDAIGANAEQAMQEVQAFYDSIEPIGYETTKVIVGDNGPELNIFPSKADIDDSGFSSIDNNASRTIVLRLDAERYEQLMNALYILQKHYQVAKFEDAAFQAITELSLTIGKH